MLQIPLNITYSIIYAGTINVVKKYTRISNIRTRLCLNFEKNNQVTCNDLKEKVIINLYNLC